MKKILVIAALSVLTGVFAQNNTKPTAPTKQASAPANDAYQHSLSVYKMAIEYNDFSAAKNAVYQLLAARPEQTTWKDTLALLYYRMQMNVECMLVSTDVLKSKPDNKEMLELKAISASNIGLVKEALSDYERLYSITKEPMHMYQIASMQYKLKRVGECEQSLAQILNSQEADKVNISITTETSRQQVPLKAAAYNMLAVINMDLAKLEAAKQHLNNALKVMPDFDLAKGNLALVEAKIKQDSAPVSPSSVPPTTVDPKKSEKKK